MFVMTLLDLVVGLLCMLTSDNYSMKKANGRWVEPNAEKRREQKNERWSKGAAEVKERTETEINLIERELSSYILTLHVVLLFKLKLDSEHHLVVTSGLIITDIFLVLIHIHVLTLCCC